MFIEMRAEQLPYKFNCFGHGFSVPKIYEIEKEKAKRKKKTKESGSLFASFIPKSRDKVNVNKQRDEVSERDVE